MKTIKGAFRLAGISRPKSCTLTFGKHEHFFWPKVELSQDRFDALWKFCSDNWDEPKWGVIEYDYLDDDGEPMNPRLVDITLNPKSL